MHAKDLPHDIPLAHIEDWSQIIGIPLDTNSQSSSNQYNENDVHTTPQPELNTNVYKPWLYDGPPFDVNFPIFPRQFKDILDTHSLELVLCDMPIPCPYEVVEGRQLEG